MDLSKQNRGLLKDEIYWNCACKTSDSWVNGCFIVDAEHLNFFYKKRCFLMIFFEHDENKIYIFYLDNFKIYVIFSDTRTPTNDPIVYPVIS